MCLYLSATIHTSDGETDNSVHTGPLGLASVSDSSALELPGPLSGPGTLPGPGSVVSPPFPEVVEILWWEDLYSVLWPHILLPHLWVSPSLPINAWPFLSVSFWVLHTLGMATNVGAWLCLLLWRTIVSLCDSWETQKYLFTFELVNFFHFRGLFWADFYFLFFHF